jgi:DAK2 domain fusion protein YloV
MSTTINANKLKEMFLAGAEKVGAEYEYINELNVFPVPDGDTGTNMKITIDGACDSIRNVNYEDINLLGKQFSRGLLMNARGNSGVIFSQIIKGFTKNFQENTNEINTNQFIDAFVEAKNTAYAAVISPVEGTMLTVIRVTAENLVKTRQSLDSIEKALQTACDQANIILEKTPDLLPELKEVGVVDSGGYGLCRFLEGMLVALSSTQTKSVATTTHKIQAKRSMVIDRDDNNEGFGYCCEFIMTLKSKVTLDQRDKEEFNLKKLKKQLNKIGNSLAIVVDYPIVKVHIHVVKPHLVLAIASQFGEFNHVKVENMTLQFLERNPGTTLQTMVDTNSKIAKTRLLNNVKIIATVPSEAMTKIFQQELKIDQVINTEISGNPSISEFITKIRETKSAKVIIIVDNSNIVLAASEAIKLIPQNVQIKLINAHDIATTYLACSAFEPNAPIKQNFNIMSKIANNSTVGKLSTASKRVSYSRIDVNKGDFIGIVGKKVVVASKNIISATKKLCDRLIEDIKKPRFAYVFCGRDIVQREKREIIKYLAETYSLETIIVNSGQLLYPYYIALKQNKTENKFLNVFKK